MLTDSLSSSELFLSSGRGPKRLPQEDSISKYNSPGFTTLSYNRHILRQRYLSMTKGSVFADTFVWTHRRYTSVMWNISHPCSLWQSSPSIQIRNWYVSCQSGWQMETRYVSGYCIVAYCLWGADQRVGFPARQDDVVRSPEQCPIILSITRHLLGVFYICRISLVDFRLH